MIVNISCLLVMNLLLQMSISDGYQTISSVSLSQMHWEYWTEIETSFAAEVAALKDTEPPCIA